MERRKARLGSNKSAFRTLHRGDFFVPGTGSSGRRREQARHPGRLSPPLRLSRPATEGSAPYWARTVTQGPPGPRLRGMAAGAASTFGLPLRPALALPHFRIASRSAPHWTGHAQDKRGRGDGDRYTFTG